jgi:Zn finger protein HypA/HybF involved in hydrogenase expression
MGIIQSIKQTVGLEDEPDNEWRCGECGNAFETHGKNSRFVTCPECESDDVELVNGS